MRHFKSWGTGVLLLAALGACSRSNAPDMSVPTTNAVVVPQTRYDMANGCYALQSTQNKAYAVHGGDGSYTASAMQATGGEPLYLKPTALGKYICYATDKSMLAVSGSDVGSVTAPSDAADWTIDTTTPGVYTLYNAAANKSLATDANGKLVLSDAAGSFKFVSTSGCTPYPEMPVDVSGATYKGQGVDKPVIGFPRGCGALVENYAERAGMDAVALDVQAPAALGRRLQKRLTIQGALDPLLLRAGGEALDARVDQMLRQWGGGPYIFNLGHGILPDTPIEHVERTLQRVTGWNAALAEG